MGVGVSVLIGSVIDIIYDLALAGIVGLTYLAETVASIAASAATLAINTTLAVVPYAVAALPFIIQYAPALAISYLAYTSPYLTAAFVFGGLAVGGATVAAVALTDTEGGSGGPTDPNNGLKQAKSNKEVQDEFNNALEFFDQKQQLRSDIAVYEEKIANSRFVAVTGDIVDDNYLNRGLNALIYLIQKKNEISEQAKAFVETSSNFVSSSSNWLRNNIRLRTASGNPPPNYDFTFEDLDQVNRGRIRLKSKQRSGQSEVETCGVTLDDYIYGIAHCKSVGRCPSFLTNKRKNVQVRSNSRSNNPKRKVRVRNRSRVNSSVRPNVNKMRTKQQNRQLRKNKVRKTTKRRRVGKQK